MQRLSFSSALLANVPMSWAVQALNDFDGDGRDDILWREESGQLALWEMNGAQGRATGYVGGPRICLCL